MKFEITLASSDERQDFLDSMEIVLDSLVDYEKSFNDFRDECPDECSNEEIESMIKRVRDVQNIVSSLMEGVQE